MDDGSAVGGGQAGRGLGDEALPSLVADQNHLMRLRYNTDSRPDLHHRGRVWWALVGGGGGPGVCISTLPPPRPMPQASRFGRSCFIHCLDRRKKRFFSSSDMDTSKNKGTQGVCPLVWAQGKCVEGSHLSFGPTQTLLFSPNPTHQNQMC